MLLAVAAAATSCAQKGFPPGGPPDISAPHVLAVHPDSGAVAVPTDAELQIVFDEKMDKRSVESSVVVTPPIDVRALHWEGAALRLTPAGDLQRRTTYTLLLTTGAMDRRGNALQRAFVSHFSTGDSIAPGAVEGVVETGRVRPKSILVWAYEERLCPPDPESTPASAVAQAGNQGRFTLGGLAPGRSYCVYAHGDEDMDHEVDERELFVGADSTVQVVPVSAGTSTVVIYLVPEDEPGVIAGVVADSAGPVGTVADSVYAASAILVLAVDLADSSNFALDEAGDDGSFLLRGLRPGIYRLEAFRDLDGDRAADKGSDPYACEPRVEVRPGREVKLEAIVLRREPPGEEGR